jgi:hypothetical protein
MAKMIPPPSSAAMHLRMAKRHIRLCARMAATKKYIASMQQAMQHLAAQENERKTASEEREYAYDDIILCDDDINNAVRTVFEKVRQYDREHHTQSLRILFRDGRFSDLIRMPLPSKPQEVKKIAYKIELLEDCSTLKPLADLLNEKVSASTKALAAHQKALERQKRVQALEDLAKLNLRTQYEHNWLDARKQYGASMADRLFPKVTTASRKNNDAAPAGNDDE